MPPRLNPRTTQLLIAQDNVVALWQLDPDQRRAASRAVKRGEWRRLTTRCILASLTSPTEHQRVWAAVLHASPHARLSGRAALTLHGWAQPHHAPFDVVVPHRVKPTASPGWIRIHRRRLTPSGPASPPARTSPHTATAHAAAWARTNREAAFLVISALQQGLTSPDRLQSTLTELPKLRRRGLTAEVARDFADGSQSLNELDFARFCRRFNLPAPTRQRRITDAHGTTRAIDVEFTANGRTVRVEIEGLHHLDPEQDFSDISRHNGLATAGVMTLRVTAWHLKHEPAAFMAELTRTLNTHLPT